MRNLKKYLSLTTAAASSTLINASVVYTDIDPDAYLSIDGDNFEIDFDNDGNAEYNILFEINNSYGGYGPPLNVNEPKIIGNFGT